VAGLQFFKDWAETIDKEWVRLDKLVTIKVTDWPDGGYAVTGYLASDGSEVTLGIFAAEEQAEKAVRYVLG
jgi:hypothetical protein